MPKRLLLATAVASLFLAPLALAEDTDDDPLGVDPPAGPPQPPADPPQPPADPPQPPADPPAPPVDPPTDPLPPVDPQPMPRLVPWLLAKAQGDSDRLQDEIDRLSDPEALQSEIDRVLQPAHQTAADAEDQITGLLTPEAPPPDEEGAPAVGTQANVVQTWPGMQPPMLIAGAAMGLGVLVWLLGQSAAVGAGAAGTAAARDGRRFLPLASPLFTRFERDTVLGHPKREAIYGHIVGRPGITLQDLCEESGLSRTAVTHHLRLLEQQHLVVSKRMGRSRHFFENGGRFGRNQKDAYAVLHNERSKQIHAFISQHPGAIQKDLCGAFAIQASVAHWHVKRLVEANLLEAVRQGRTVSYFPSGQAPQTAYA